MSKTIYEQITSGQIEVNHQITGYSQQTAITDLPEWLRLDDATLYDENALVSHLADNGILLKVIHCGLQKAIIDVRATFRPCPTKSDPNPEMDTAERHRKVQRFVPNLIPKQVTESEKVVKGFKELDKDTQLELLKAAGFTAADLE